MDSTEYFSFGSVCSGIEAAHLALNPLGFNQLWSSEIADFPKKVLSFHYPHIANVGDMTNLSDLILNRVIVAPSLLCGGTPCQAFSLAGWKKGLHDSRGQLTIAFLNIANAIDTIRAENNQKPSLIFWENVEGVLNDKTNVFGNFIAGLAGLSDELKVTKWSKAGFLRGTKRNVAWRVLDAKYFGVPQQRRRLYLIAGDTDSRPDQMLFEFSKIRSINTFDYETLDLVFYKNNTKFEIFRAYTDCLYSAYGTKWNGNAAAYNGSLYVAQNNRIRRFTPLECERLMGLPDNYTLVPGQSDTNRYQAIGNSWAVPVINWIGQQIIKQQDSNAPLDWFKNLRSTPNNLNAELYLLPNEIQLDISTHINASSCPNLTITGDMRSVINPFDNQEKFFLSQQACRGILRRKQEKAMNMNNRLEKLLHLTAFPHALQTI